MEGAGRKFGVVGDYHDANLSSAMAPKADVAAFLGNASKPGPFQRSKNFTR